jgi:hypothetical protein
MAYSEDLSEYRYFEEYAVPRAKNVGWLSRDHAFEKEQPSDVVLQKLWQYCKLTVGASRGWHCCDFCGDEDGITLQFGAEFIRGGTSEIRVFSPNGTVYAAPNLIFHYIAAHNYKPPQEFLSALLEGVCPPDAAYLDLLESHGLEWQEATILDGPVQVLKLTNLPQHMTLAEIMLQRAAQKK